MHNSTKFTDLEIKVNLCKIREHTMYVSTYPGLVENKSLMLTLLDNILVTCRQKMHNKILHDAYIMAKHTSLCMC